MSESTWLDPAARLPYCRGCGHSLIVRQLSKAFESLDLPPSSLALTTDIGCLGLVDSLFPHLHTVHTTHGRSTAFATGIALAESAQGDSDLKPIVMIGDGGAMIGLLHLVHAAQLNVDITVLVHNNWIFGMTGGQHSAMSPEGLVTSTTPEGNTTPPLDLLGLLRAAHAGYLNRVYATDPALSDVIAEAVSFRGFAVVEVLELCTAFTTRMNPLTGKTLREWVERMGLQMGRFEQHSERAPFDETMNIGNQAPAAQQARLSLPTVEVASQLATEQRIVLAGSAGEKIQSSAHLLCRAALVAGLYSTQKNDNPVTQGTGFSLSELCLSPNPIDYTGLEKPDVVILASQDGWNECRKNGIFSRCEPETLIVMDAELDNPPCDASLWRLPLRQKGTPQRAALAGIAAWLAKTGLLPGEAWSAVLAQLPDKHRADRELALQTGAALAADHVT